MTITEILKNKFPKAVLDSHQNYGDETVFIEKSQIIEVLQFLKLNEDCQFNQLMDLCGVDYMGQSPRFEVVYHLYSLTKKHRLRIRVKISENNLEIESCIPVYKAANWFEREAWEMFGIVFKNHPKLRRLLTWEGFQGHPLRKDYPIDKRQPIPDSIDIV